MGEQMTNNIETRLSENDIRLADIKRRKALLKKIPGKALEIYEKMTAFASELLVKYPGEETDPKKDARQYRLFHELIGSSEDAPLFDFPKDEDSVAKKIEELCRDYGVE